jgi:hypothetical protein
MLDVLERTLVVTYSHVKSWERSTVTALDHIAAVPADVRQLDPPPVMEWAYHFQQHLDRNVVIDSS